MANISKRDTSWRAQIAIQGIRESKSFSTKAQALAWVSQRETEIRIQKDTGILKGKTFEDACRRYELEVSKHKRGYRWEALRLNALVNFEIDGKRLGDIELADMSSDLIGRWRDLRMRGTEGTKAVSGSTINRILNLWSHVLNIAAIEWKWVSHSPTKDVRRPKESPHRDRRPTQDEIDRIKLYCGFNDAPIETKMQAVAVAYLFAIETAMRQGEICGLLETHINGSVAHLPKTKNGMKRDVPLSKQALTLLSYLPKPEKAKDNLFMLSADSLSTLFRKATKACLIENLTFHDSRHEAITRLAKKLNVLDLARMVGHKDLRMLQVYYNESAAEIASRLD